MTRGRVTRGRRRVTCGRRRVTRGRRRMTRGRVTRGRRRVTRGPGRVTRSRRYVTRGRGRVSRGRRRMTRDRRCVTRDRRRVTRGRRPPHILDGLDRRQRAREGERFIRERIMRYYRASPASLATWLDDCSWQQVSVFVKHNALPLGTTFAHLQQQTWLKVT